MDISGEIQEVLVFLYSFILSEKNSFSLKSKNQSKWPVSEILSEEYFSWHGVMHMRNVPNNIVQIENLMTETLCFNIILCLIFFTMFMHLLEIYCIKAQNKKKYMIFIIFSRKHTAWKCCPNLTCLF